MSAPDAARDIRLMRLALALGRRNNGRTWPNPSVGAVLLDPRTGAILATGITSPGGRPHAEPLALAAAGDRARGATLFVSLEPCSHHGATPPCAEAIVAAGVARVVTALQDPDPRVAGRGHAILRAAGIVVETGRLAAEAERAHRGHLTRVRLGRPAVALKLARTADGYAAGAPGEGRLLISGGAAQARTHRLRAHADAIMVGVSTVAADDPGLDVRLPGLADRSPLPVILDSRLRLPPASRLARAARDRPTWLVATTDADQEAEERLVASGLVVLRVPAAADGRVSLPAALAALAGRGLTRILCEGGPTLADALAAEGLVDEVHLLTGRTRLGRPGLAALGPHLAAGLAAGFSLAASESAGEDVVDRYERHPCSPAS